jgi:hypothetical protein
MGDLINEVLATEAATDKLGLAGSRSAKQSS